jgi:hypothetical protein
MRHRWYGVLAGAALVAAVPATWRIAAAQRAEAPPRRFTFSIVESFNAKYLGDSPGHHGRGSIRGERPDVALGDPVLHGDVKIGTVSGLIWDRTKESLEVEVDPDDFEVNVEGQPIRANRIAVGEEVWVPLGGSMNIPKKP